MVLRIAIPSPLRRLFDYLPPRGGDSPYCPGQRLLVPFGRQKVVGILMEVAECSDCPIDKLRHAERLLDEVPLLPEPTLALIRWAADYYHHAPGEVVATAIPALLRQGKPAEAEGITRWRLTEEGLATDPATLGRAHRQRAVLERLRTTDGPRSPAELDPEADLLPVLKRLAERGWVEPVSTPCIPAPTPADGVRPELNPDQREAVQTIAATLGRFQPFLLDGVTGSGKTEVYLHAIEAALARGEQSLLLVPEIGLTPQLLERFRRRFAVPIAILHSGLADGERLCAWLSARDGQAPIVIGTRSAAFTPLKRPGLFIVDEEHDASFKQQEGFRYSARDLLVMRARQAGVPVVLGSATPALESLHNAAAGRYLRLTLPERAGSANHPKLHILDVRHRPLEGGLSDPLIARMGQHLEAGGQVLIFINRRGYAPVLLCHECGWVSRCSRCDAHTTLYAGQRRIRCHHCGSERAVPRQCPDCGSPDLRPVGQGTERVEEVLAERFPGVALERIDRDSVRRKGAMEAALARVHSGSARVLVGTQMLAKGHDFPLVTLVGILDADQGLFSADFRATERMAQLIMQVAGRAGRAERPGEVLIQTHQPDHPLLRRLVEAGYGPFAIAALAERRDVAFPPFSHLALLRAEALDPAAPTDFLRLARSLGEPHAEGVSLLGPVPAPMERRAGRYRAQLLLLSPQRAPLHRLLDAWLPRLEGLKEGRKVRWSLDVDPVEMF